MSELTVTILKSLFISFDIYFLLEIIYINQEFNKGANHYINNKIRVLEAHLA